MDKKQFVELNEKLLPTGKIKDVTGTTFDFREGRELGDGLNGKTIQNQIADDGYDHYFIFDNNSVDAIVARDSNSGRILSIQTNQPGVVMYTSNTLPEGLPLTEDSSRRYLGVCFETQSSLGSLHEKGLPSVILEAGEVYEKQTVFTFSVED